MVLIKCDVPNSLTAMLAKVKLLNVKWRSKYEAQKTMGLWSCTGTMAHSWVRSYVPNSFLIIETNGNLPKNAKIELIAIYLSLSLSMSTGQLVKVNMEMNACVHRHVEPRK